MRLGLSSTAAPDAHLDELLEACARRGLRALELRDGDEHGVSDRPHGIGGAAARERAHAAGVVISGFRSEDADGDLRLVPLATAAGAPILVGGGSSMASRVERALALDASGVGVAVVIDGQASSDGAGRRAMSPVVALDVRPVEPKHRFERIMAAYDGLGSGQTLDLTVDHDPKCMYYTLKATRGDGAFSFDYLAQGPETWRVLVRKTAPEVPG